MDERIPPEYRETRESGGFDWKYLATVLFGPPLAWLAIGAAILLAMILLDALTP